MAGLRTGVDLASVGDVRDAVAARGPRYLDRVFTRAEQAAAARADGSPDPRRLAGCFAAKEAAFKVLRPGDVGVPWTAIEVVPRSGRTVALRWRGPAADVAARQGLGPVAVSVTTTRDTASAVAVARTAGPHPEVAPPPGTAVTLAAMSSASDDTIRQILADHARLSGDPASLGRDDDLYAAGMTSHASVNVMLALEEGFDVEFPDEMLKRSVFQSIDSIATAVDSLKES
nr:acyl carrier protein [Patulibacter minatonensis]